MKILITGASGFIGRNLVPRLACSGRELYLMDRSVRRPVPAHVRFMKADMTDSASMRRLSNMAPRLFDVCVNLAGHTDMAESVSNPVMDLVENAVSVMNLLSVFKFKRLIHISTGSVYDGQSGMASADKPIIPKIPYAISKYVSELYIKSFEKIRQNPSQYIILRLFNPYGPQEDPKRFIPRLVRLFGLQRKRRLVIRGSGTAMVDPMHIDDCVDAILKAVSAKTFNRVIDICRGNPMTLIELAGRIASIFGITPRVTCAGASEEEIRFYGDPGPQSRLLGFRPRVSLREGIERYADFLRLSRKAGE
jgi:nucleoside-diphosphate-sugar epimerase